MSKITVEECLSIDTSRLKKWGCFDNYYYGSFNWRIDGEICSKMKAQVDLDNTNLRLMYSQTDRETGKIVDFNYLIRLSKTSCNYGGCRYWFHCPYCGKRKRTLYLYANHKFACRECLNLSYESQNKWGIEKIIGKCLSDQELDDLYDSMRLYYNGKITKKHKLYLKYEEKSYREMMTFLNRNL